MKLHESSFLIANPWPVSLFYVKDERNKYTYSNQIFGFIEYVQKTKGRYKSEEKSKVNEELDNNIC